MKNYTIGRDNSSQIILTDSFVSRKHAELIISDNGQVKIKDLGSSNGTFVNGKRVTEFYLNPGDVVKCANSILNWQQYVMTTTHNPGKSYPEHAPAPDQQQKFPVQNMDSQIVSSVASQSSKNFHESVPQSVQQNVIIMGKAKSVGAAFILAFFFGPLGLLYASIIGGIVMFFVGIISWFIIPIFGYFIAHIGCIIWAKIAANQANAALHNQAGGLINNYYQK